MSETRHGPSALIREAASIFHLIGGVASKHLVIVGGLVPPLLVPDAHDAHLGSRDIDFCLSVAITEGATREYAKSIEEIIKPHFEPATASGFRWRKKEGAPGVPLLIDFLGPGEEGDSPLQDGTRELTDETAAANAGTHLRPFPIRVGRLIDEDAITTTIKAVELLYRPGAVANVTIRHAGPVGFLAAKADALEGRDEPKDGYDVSWWCLNAASSPDEVAALVVSRPAFKHELFQESVQQLQTAFAGPRYVGPDGYAREKNPDLDAGDEIFEQDRNRAFLAVSQVIEILRQKLWE